MLQSIDVRGQEPCLDGVLVVDLEGVLTRGDIGLERHWALASKNVPAALMGLARLQGSHRSAIGNDALANQLRLSPSVLMLLQRWREAGGQTHLRTCQDLGLAEAVANRLGLFDRVLMSPPGRAAAVDEPSGGVTSENDGRPVLSLRLGGDGELAVGNAASLPQLVREALAAVTTEFEHKAGRMALVRATVRAMRPHQYLKNTLVAVPALAAHDPSIAVWGATLAAFVSFCLVASAVYLLNDLLDLEADRAHARKRNRPLASGAMPLRLGTALAPALFLAGLLVAYATGGLFLVAAMLGYIAMTSAYSFYLKRKIVIDICMLAGLYTSRIIVGAIATGLPISVWLLAFSTFLFLSLATVKRQAEMVGLVFDKKTSMVGRAYNVEDMPIVSSMAIASGYLSVLVLAFYVDAPIVRERYALPEALWLICALILYWISRTIILTHRGLMTDDPIVFAVRDRTSRICIALICVWFCVASFVSI